MPTPTPEPQSPESLAARELHPSYSKDWLDCINKDNPNYFGYLTLFNKAEEQRKYTEAIITKHFAAERASMEKKRSQLEQELNEANHRCGELERQVATAQYDCLKKCVAERDTMKRERDEAIEIIAKLSGVPNGSPYAGTIEESCAFTYSDWMIVRQMVIDERDQLREVVNLLESKEQIEIAEEVLKLRKVVDEAARLLDEGSFESEVKLFLESHAKLPHVKQKETK